jgi:hypothetical protein
MFCSKISKKLFIWLEFAFDGFVRNPKSCHICKTTIICPTDFEDSKTVCCIGLKMIQMAEHFFCAQKARHKQIYDLLESVALRRHFLKA